MNAPLSPHPPAGADMQEFALRTRKSPGHAWLALAIVAAIVLVLTSAWRQGWFTPTSHIYIEVSGASGIQVGTPVRLKGFKIGEVDDVKLEKNLSVRVRLRIETEKTELLATNASAKFGRDSPIAGKFIELLPGSRDGQRLADGQTVPVDAGNELDDVMATVKVAVDRLSVALGKIDPILDDTRKLTNEAVSMRQTLSSSLTATLANIQAMSGQFRQTSESARVLVGNIDGDRAKVVGEVQGLLKILNNDLPQALDKAKDTLDNAKTASADVKQLLRESRNDIPAIVRSGRTAAQDAAEITTSLKSSWPFSGAARAAESVTLPLDSFEGRSK